MTETNDYLIETRGLTRRFGSQLAVDDLNLLVPAAGVYGFLGPNGAGKTTAIRMLLGLIRPNAGEVRSTASSIATNSGNISSLPVPRSAVYFAKLIVAQGLMLTSTLVLAVVTVIVGVAGMYLRPELANAGPVPYIWLAKQVAFVWLASWLIIAIHTWISIRWSGFPIALGAGIGGTFFALFAAGASLGKYYPWLLPMNIFVDGRFAMALLLGVGGGIVAAVLGCLEFTRRDVM